MLAYVQARVAFRGKRLFHLVCLVPIVSPPFAVATASITLFGRNGLISKQLLGQQWNIYGLSGLTLVLTLSFFPVAYMNLLGMFRSLDPTMEEAASSLGASRWTIFRTVTLPMMIPGIAASFLLLFVEAIADLANPLVIGGDICAAPLYAAYYQGYFSDAGLNVTLARTQRTEDTKDAVGAGKYIGAPGIFFSWLEPIYNGLNAKLTGGFHSGCLQLVVANDSPVASLADLRGKRIGVPSLSSSAFAYFAIGLSRAGLNVDPEGGDITWTTIDEDSLGTRLTNGDVDAIMGSDPAPLLPVLDGRARVLASNKDEPFCCSVALNGDFVKDSPEQAKALTEAWFKGSDYLAADEAHLDEIAKIEVDNNYVAADLDVVKKLLRTYGWRASAVEFRTAIEPGIEDFKGTGFIRADVTAAELANAVFADLGITR